ncbi:MAG TPA: hypothetical protein PK668_22935 [Myxococcota bacterium]|nr:hypothetical protein [Myxococcota bacterium]HRY95551.1 hypothetical protein [Myxococcota bacterium]HSA21696.1 hypothetical protein [Myxococcota bacterium]
MQRIALLLVLAAGCGPGGPFDLQISFPDEAARAACARLHLWVIAPGEGAACAALAGGAAAPGDDGFAVEADLAFAYPPAGDPPALAEVGPGLRLFFAEGEDGGGQAFLRGCTPDQAGSGGPTRVRIELARISSCTPTAESCNGLDDDCDQATDEGSPAALCPPATHAAPTACLTGVCEYACDPGWIDTSGGPADGCECRQSRGGLEWCDGLDNDCDGGVDGAGCLACAADDDCQAPADCLGGTCQAGQCAVTPLGDGTGCDDLDPCTSGDTCQAGACQGTAYSCDDGQYCNGAETCDGLGGCQNAGPPCVLTCKGACDEEADACQPDPPTTACEDGVSCTGDDACDGAGGCQGTPIPGYCGAAEECLPACSLDPSGCVRRPDYLVLTCPDIASAGDPAGCELSAVNAEGTEGCAACTASLLPSLLDTTRWRQCELGDWTLETVGCARNLGCDLDASDEQPCCEFLACAADPQGINLAGGLCGDSQNGWRLSKLFDFQPFERVRFCATLSQQPDGEGDILQVQTDRGDDLLGTLVACYPPSSFDPLMPTYACSELPLSVTDQPVTRLTLRAEVGDLTSSAVLGEARVWGFPPECSQETEHMRTRFEGCAPAEPAFAGWSFSGGGPTCATGDQCGFTGGLVLGSMGADVVGSINASYSLTGPHASIRLPAELCWKTYASPGFSGRYGFSMAGGGGGVWYFQVYESQFTPGWWEGECREQCVDLSPIGSAMWGSEFLSLSLEGEAPDGAGGLLINDVVLRSAQQCQADGVIQLGSLDSTVTPALLPVQDVTGQPRHVRIDCTWGTTGPSTYDEFDFR